MKEGMASLKENIYKTINSEIPEFAYSHIRPVMIMGWISMGSSLIQLVLLWDSDFLKWAPYYFLLMGLLFFFISFCRKYDIVITGYRKLEFRVIGYTALTRFARKPDGIMLAMEDASGLPDRSQDYHIAYQEQCGIPYIGESIIVYVPKDAKMKKYKDRIYFSRVLGYELL